MSAEPARIEEPFAAAREEYREIEAYLGSKETRGMRHSDLERELEKRGRELMRQLLQAHLEVRGPGEAEGPVEGSDGVVREQERVHERGLETVFGEVKVERLGYGAEGTDSLHPLDAELNLPKELYSHEVRRRVAAAVAEGSFDKAVAGLEETTGAKVGKRQMEELAARAAQDFDAFYEARGSAWSSEREKMGAVLVISVDGKGVVMRRSDLREATRKRAEASRHKLQTRLSRGEKRNSKRMATVATVYTIAPYVRRPEDVVRTLAPHNEREDTSRPRPEHKRVWASVEKTPEEVIKEAIREARSRDPDGRKQWVALVDGSLSQLKILRQLLRRYGVRAPIVVDFIHVSEYVWKAGTALHGESNPELDTWVSERLLQILHNRCGHVAAGMRRSATLREFSSKARKAVDRCADYLLKNSRFIQYEGFLTLGVPIATGVVEGACRYLIKDRMDVTGARWSLAGAEAVLKLRALRASGDFDAYWRFHEEQEYHRNHVVHYALGKVVPVHREKRPRLKLIK
jgi:hypothetical protein